MNEIVREDPNRTAVKMAKMESQITGLKTQLEEKKALIAKFQSEAKELESIGPLKSAIE